MPYGWIDPEIAVDHDGITIWHTYEDDQFYNQKEEDIYTYSIKGNIDKWKDVFYIEELPNYRPEVPHYGLLREAISLGLLTQKGIPFTVTYAFIYESGDILLFPEEDNKSCEEVYVILDDSRLTKKFPHFKTEEEAKKFLIQLAKEGGLR